MIIRKFETWTLARDKNFFDDTRRAGSPIPWDVVVLKLTDDDGTEGVATALAARSGRITENYLQDIIASVVLGRNIYEREAIWHQLWTIDRHLTFFPLYLPGPLDTVLWDMAARKASLPLYRYLGAQRSSLPVYASGLFHGHANQYADEALKYKAQGIHAYKSHPPGPWQKDIEISHVIREAVGPDHVLMCDPVAEYTIDQATRVGRALEELDYYWFEEPFRDYEIEKYARLCETLDIPIANTETTRGGHWGVAQYITRRATDIVRADVSWKAGITGTMKIAHTAEAHGLNCEIHTTTMGCMDYVNLHVSCAIRNCEYFELFVPEEEFMFPSKTRLPVDENGMIHIGNEVGTGINLDWDLVDKHCTSYRIKEI